MQHLARQRVRYAFAETLVDGRQLVGDALVAVDAGPTLGKALLVGAGRAAGLLRIVEEAEVVAVAAFLRVVALHARPFALGHHRALGLELLRRVDAAKRLVQQLVGGIELAHHLWPPLLRHVAVRADRTHPGAVVVVDGVAVLLVHVDFHLVAGDAELFSVGQFHDGVETAPEDDAQHEGQAHGAERQPHGPEPQFLDLVHE
ncbi:hypothetical protein D3C77_530200 [compost metagenome]